MRYIDQMNREVILKKVPERIISLVPSQTEFLADLGVGEHLVGVTKFCVHPQGFKQDKTIIGGTKNFHFDKIDALKPDLIIGNKEENYQEGIERLAEKHPVWMSDIFNLQDALVMMNSIGEITGRKERAYEITRKISDGFLEELPVKGTAVYLIWQDPLIVVGKNTFIDDMLQRAGFENRIGKERYPEVSREDILALDPDYILLSSEPYPFKEKHIMAYQQIFPNAIIKLVDGEMLSWYGSRLLKAADYFRNLGESS